MTMRFQVKNGYSRRWYTPDATLIVPGSIAEAAFELLNRSAYPGQVIFTTNGAIYEFRTIDD